MAIFQHTIIRSDEASRPERTVTREPKQTRTATATRGTTKTVLNGSYCLLRRALFPWTTAVRHYDFPHFRKENVGEFLFDQV